MMTRYLTTSLIPLTLAISLLSGCSSLYEKDDSDVVPDDVTQVQSLPGWVTQNKMGELNHFGTFWHVFALGS